MMLRRLSAGLAQGAVGFLSAGALVVAQSSAPASGSPPAYDGEAVRAANFACSRELETNPVRALVLCREAVNGAEAIPDKTFGSATNGDYENPWRAYVSGVIAVGRSQDDVDALRVGLANRARIGRGEDKVAAAAHFALAMVLQRLGRHQEAEAEFTAADVLNAKIALNPSMVSNAFADDRKFMLQQHAAYRRARGDAAGALTLETQAAALMVPEPVRPVLTSRQIGDITVVESTRASVAADDVREIQSIVDGVWWIETGLDQDSKLTVSACGPSDVVAGTVQRGRCWGLIKEISGAGGRSRWTQRDAPREYVRVTGGGLLPRPMTVIGTFSDDELMSVVSFLRSQAVASPTSRPSADVQPWPIGTVMRSGTDLSVTLLKEDGTTFQSIKLRQHGDGWSIVDMR